MQQLRETIENGAARDCAREVLDSVPPVIWFIRREMRVFRKGLSLPQFRTLSLVHRQPTASLSAVADHLAASLPTASRLVQGLVQQGLLKREGCPGDRRQLSLAITERGESVLQTAWEGTQGRLAEQFEKLDPTDRRAVTEAMAVLKNIFGALGLPDSPRSAAKDRTVPNERPSLVPSPLRTEVVQLS
ncbi:MAG: MarR family transcriptional regulator [Tepidisphaeraceae bacterium]|jgi:DNA-binding MarR family transcriptional regulator